MKILRCFVENFGVISKESFDFDGKLSCIYKENGQGKTTLLVFIKAMLFSLEATTRRALDENERNKYRPWNGGRFGGWLEFSSDTLGASYRVTRFFGEKESLDTLEIIDLSTGLDASDVFEGQSIGVCLFGIDAEGFERTLFLSERSFEIKNSGSITQKISALASGDDDSYENAVKILDNKRKFYKNNQNRGYLIDLEEKLRQRNSELDDLLIKSENVKRLENELSEQKNRLDEISIKKIALEDRADNISKALIFKTKQKSVKALSDRSNELALEKQQICARYKNGVATLDDARRIQQEIDRLRKLFAQNSNDQSADIQGQIRALEAKIGAVDITKEEIPALLKKHSDAQSVDLEALDIQRKNALSEYESCKNTLPNEPFDENELETAKDINEKIKSLEREKNALTDKYLELSRQNEGAGVKDSDKKAFMALCLALVSLVFATLALTVTPWLWVVFAIAMGGGGVFGVSAMKMRRENTLKKQRFENEKSELDVRIQEIKDQISELEAQSAKIKQKYQPYGGDISNVKERFTLCAQLKDKYEELSQKYTDEKAKADRIISELSQKLLPYKCEALSGDMGQMLMALSGDLERLEILRSNLEIAKNQQKDLALQIEDGEKQLFGFINGLVCESVEERGIAAAQSVYNLIMLDISSMPRLENEILDLQRSLNGAEASDQLDFADDTDIQKDESELSAELESVKNELITLEKERATIQGVAGRLESALEVLYDRCEDIPVIEQEIEEISQKVRAAEEEFAIVVKTMELLEKAKNSLVSRYLGAIRDNFADIFCKITENENESVKLDAKLALKFEREGTLRDLQYFSRGMRDIMDFSLRMALVKTLFVNEEAPFILLDDPFASLDEKHLEIAKRCLSDIANEYQIVYTVCSEDRKINI